MMSLEQTTKDIAEEAKAVAKFKAALADIVSVAPFMARWGDGNCGHILNEVLSAMHDSGYYSFPTPTQNKDRRKAIGSEKRTMVYERNAYRCVKCGSYESLTVDHIIPIAKGGTNDLDNLQTMCRRCNCAKGDR